MNDKTKEQEINQAAIDAYLAKGGKVQKIPHGQRTDPAEIKNQWGRPPKKTAVPKT
jgi:hypothetical protein